MFTGELEFAAALDFERVEGPGVFTSYFALADRPQFSVLGLPADLPFGMYRLSVETPDASHVLDESLIFAECRGAAALLPVRVTLERGPDRLDIFFLLPPEVVSLRFAPHFHRVSELRVASVSLSRASTTRRLLRRVAGAVGRNAASPADLWRNATALSRSVRSAGWSGLRQEWTELSNPRVILPVTMNTDPSDARWFSRMIGLRNREALAAHAPALAGRPAASLSMVVPVYRTAQGWLGDLVDSMNRQTDQDFELVLVFDGPQPELQAFAEARVAGRFRVVAISLEENRGVSAASNAGIRAATGDYIIVVDHDDVLERHLVAAFRRAAAHHPADLYFADEAITNEGMDIVHGVASRGRFDIRYYLSHPYIVHPIFIRRELIVEAGLFDETLRVSHDIDLVLRCLARAKNVVQIPLVLYFWRTHARSLGHQAMGQVSTNTRAAIRRYLERTTRWSDFEVLDGINFNEYDVRPPCPEGSRVAIVIPTKNRLGLLSTCLASLYTAAETNEVPADIYVVDHESDDPKTVQYLEREAAAGRITVIAHRGPWNFPAINNRAVEAILGKRDYSHIAFMNNDIEIVTDQWLDRMVSQFSYGDVGVVGCCLQYPNGQVQHAGVVVGLGEVAEHAHKFERLVDHTTGRRYPSHLCSLVATRDYHAVTAALMVVSTKLFQAVGGFDEKLAVGFNDTDLCLRIGALGFRSTYVGGVVAVHFESMSRGHAPHEADTALFRDRYAAIIEGGDDNWATMLDHSSAAAKVTLTPQRRFRFVETVLHHQNERREQPQDAVDSVK